MCYTDKDTKLLAFVLIPLLNRGSIFEVFQAVNLPIQYPGTKQGLAVTAKYKIEATYIALNPARSKFMLLTAPEVEKCRIDMLLTCPSRSPVYTIGDNQTCLLGLFNGDKEDIERTCHIEVSKSKLMPQAISLSDEVWPVALERKLDLSQVCLGRPTLTIKATPPLTIISLPMGCMAFRKSITLPPFYQAGEKFESRDSFLALSNVSSGQ